jgi:hypothetical protein
MMRNFFCALPNTKVGARTAKFKEKGAQTQNVISSLFNQTRNWAEFSCFSSRVSHVMKFLANTAKQWHQIFAQPARNNRKVQLHSVDERTAIEEGESEMERTARSSGAACFSFDRANPRRKLFFLSFGQQLKFPRGGGQRRRRSRHRRRRRRK